MALYCGHAGLAFAGALVLRPSTTTAQAVTFDVCLQTAQFDLYPDPYNGNQKGLGLSQIFAEVNNDRTPTNALPSSMSEVIQKFLRQRSQRAESLRSIRAAEFGKVG